MKLERWAYKKINMPPWCTFFFLWISHWNQAVLMGTDALYALSSLTKECSARQRVASALETLGCNLSSAKSPSPPPWRLHSCGLTDLPIVSAVYTTHIMQALSEVINIQGWHDHQWYKKKGSKSKYSDTCPKFLWPCELIISQFRCLEKCDASDVTFWASRTTWLP